MNTPLHSIHLSAFFARKVCQIIIPLLCFVSLSAQENDLYLNETFRLEHEWRLYQSDTQNVFFTSIKPFHKSEVEFFWGRDREIVMPKERSFEKKWKQILWDKFWNDHLINIVGKDYAVHIDPIFHFNAGREWISQRTTWTNTRGFLLEGNLGKQFSFASRFYENQSIFAPHEEQEIRRTQVISGEQPPKAFGEHGFDWYRAEGYIAYSAPKYFHFTFGNTKNFFGDGYRSLLLSDHASPYIHFKVETQFWKIKYVNLWAQLQDMQRANNAHFWNKKWLSTHYLSWQATPRWNISLFEAVIWDNGTDATAYRGFEWHYLNPIIFYRAVEYGLSSPDNVLLGLNSSLRIGEKHIFYGQFLLDEFKLSEVKARKGWWANKNGFQVGYKGFDFASIPHLYFQIEYNQVFPYTYSHWSSQECYGNLNQPLAHPSGANFREVVARISYRYRRFFWQSDAVWLNYGTDKEGLNYGGNIFSSYQNPVHIYGNKIGQGNPNSAIHQSIQMSYLINDKYNLNAYIQYQHRTHTIKQNSANTIKEHSHWFTMGISTAIDHAYRNYF